MCTERRLRKNENRDEGRGLYGRLFFWKEWDDVHCTLGTRMLYF